MITLNKLVAYIGAEPFRSFRLHVASGRTFDVRHPELISLKRSSIVLHHPLDEDDPSPPRWEEISLLLMESIETLEDKAPSARPA